MTLPQARFSDHTPQPHTNETTVRRPYLRGAFVAIPVVFYVLCKLSNQQTALYELLVRWADRCGIVTTPQATIAYKLGCKPTSLTRHLAVLVEKGLVSFLRKNPLKTLSKLLRRELLSGVFVHPAMSVLAP